MAVYLIAGIAAEYNCKYPLLKNRSEKYKTENIKPDFTLELDESYYISRRKILPDTSDEVLEYIGTGSAFYKELLKYQGVMLHASAVAVDGYAYLFSAPCRMGKSTHTKKWQELLGKENAVIINDDKPAIRKVNGVYYAFGTPFSGKDDKSVNNGYPIKAICFIRSHGKNSIHKIDSSVAVIPFFNQTLRPEENEYMDLLCRTADDLFQNVQFYSMDCDESIEAAEMSYNAMKGGKINENKA